MELANSDFGLETSNASGCRKPLKPIVGIFTGGISNINYKKRLKAYQDCIAAQSIPSSTTAPAPPAPDKQTEVQIPPSDSRTFDEESPKFLGMPKKVGVTVAIVGGLALLVGGFLLIRKINK